MNNVISSAETEVVHAFASLLEGAVPSHHVKQRPDGDFLVFEFAKPSNRLFELLAQVNEGLSESHPYKDRITVGTRRKRLPNVLESPEVVLLQRELSASLTVDRNTFGKEFFDRYTPSVTDLERQIIVNANHVVYGRRGSGKSSLLLYAMHRLELQQQPFAWIAMQTYASRSDIQAVASVLADIFDELRKYVSNSTEFAAMAVDLLKLGEEDNETVVANRLKRLIPRMRQMIAAVSSTDHQLTIFLDDLHVLGHGLQPELLGTLYSLTRGNRCFIKISGISQLTNLWDGKKKRGLEAPHDVQTLMLDHNLTSPDQSKDHIKSILDEHALYSGIPGISYISSDELLDRLVLSAAAVPRDALNLFNKAITRSLTKKQKLVSVTSLNAATSDSIEEKLKDIEKDTSDDDRSAINNCLDQVKKFCLSKQKQNAFLVKIANSSAGYLNVQRLVALRFIHVLHEGTTPHKAGERYMALMLDYGFYIGIRAAKSVKLFPDRPRPLAAKELRTLPIFLPLD